MNCSVKNSTCRKRLPKSYVRNLGTILGLTFNFHLEAKVWGDISNAHTLEALINAHTNLADVCNFLYFFRIGLPSRLCRRWNSIKCPSHFAYRLPIHLKLREGYISNQITTAHRKHPFNSSWNRRPYSFVLCCLPG